MDKLALGVRSFFENEEDMKKFFLKIGAWLALRCRFYYAWSKFYQWFWEDGEMATQGMPEYDDYQRIEEIVKNMMWRKDTWIMLFDAISRPQATWYRHLHGQKAGDCDDISLFAINRLHNLAVRNEGRIVERGVYIPVDLASFGLLSSPWILSGKAGGHNVGVFRYRSGESWLWAHVSNWYGGVIRFGFQSLPAVVADIIAGEYGRNRGQSESIGWAVADLNLKLKEYHWSHKL